MAQQTYPNIWYATEERVNSATKMVVFDDRGSLEVTSDKLSFKGKKMTVDISRNNITGISIAKQKMNWVMYLILNGFIIMYFSLFQWNIVFLIGLLVLANGFGLLVGLSTKWIMVEYKDKENNGKKAYFADASGAGWTGIFDGTQRIYEQLYKS